VTKIRDRKIKQRTDLAVLKFQGVAVLVELGFVANDGDRAKLLDAQVRQAVVRSVAAVTIERMAADA
jgi:N-acetylmuramoyl-L-alanine amidase